MGASLAKTGLDLGQPGLFRIEVLLDGDKVRLHRRERSLHLRQTLTFDCDLRAQALRGRLLGGQATREALG
jgi:hypothetical protein